MRSHQQIISDAGTDVGLAPMIGEDVKPFNVGDWRRRNSIPAERWKRFVDLRLTTYEELAAYAAAGAPIRAA